MLTSNAPHLTLASRRPPGSHRAQRNTEFTSNRFGWNVMLLLNQKELSRGSLAMKALDCPLIPELQLRATSPSHGGWVARRPGLAGRLWRSKSVISFTEFASRPH